jgi:hypothetical protein
MSEVSAVYEETYYVSQIGVDEAYNGMVVLTMKPESRTSYVEGNDLNNSTYDKYNRWCRVSGITVRPSGIRFFGTYADGSQLLHFSDYYDGWYVKIDSIPVEELTQKIRDILKVESDDCTCHRAQEIELGMMDTVEAPVELFQETARPHSGIAEVRRLVGHEGLDRPSSQDTHSFIVQCLRNMARVQNELVTDGMYSTVAHANHDPSRGRM